MKRLLLLILVCFLFCLFSPIAFADTYGDLYSGSGMGSAADSLSEETKEILAELELDPSDYESFLEWDIDSFFDVVLKLFGKGLKKPLASFIAAMAVILLFALIGGMKGEKSELGEILGFCLLLCVSSVVLMPLVGTMREAVAALKGASAFMLSFIPIFIGIIISSGGITSGMLYRAGLISVCEAIGLLSANVISPLIGIFMGLGASAAVSGNEGIGRLSLGIKSIANWALGFIMTLFTGFLSLQSVIGKAADNLASKTTKFFVGSFVPVVGGALSEALNTVTAGMGILKSTASVWCIVALGAIFLPILIELLLWRLMLSLASASAEIVSAPDVGKLFGVCSAAVGFIIGIMLSVFVMLLISLAAVSMGRGG